MLSTLRYNNTYTDIQIHKYTLHRYKYTILIHIFINTHYTDTDTIHTQIHKYTLHKYKYNTHIYRYINTHSTDTNTIYTQIHRYKYIIHTKE